MKKALITVVIIFAFLLTSGLLLLFNVQKVFEYLGSFQTTTVSVYAEFDEDYVDFEFSLLLLSNVPFKIFVEKLNYTVYFDSTQFSEGTKIFNREFKKGEGDTLTLPLRMDINELTKIMESFEPDDSTNLNIDMGVFIDFPIVGIKEIELTVNLYIPVPVIPEIEVQSVNFTDFSFKNMILSVNLDIINPGPIDLIIEEAILEIDFPDMFSGTILFEDRIKINANDQVNTSLMVVTEDLNLVRDGLKILFKKEQRDYELTGSMKLISPEMPKNVIELTIYSSGKTYLMRHRIEGEKQEE